MPTSLNGSFSHVSVNPYYYMSQMDVREEEERRRKEGEERREEILYLLTILPFSATSILAPSGRALSVPASVLHVLLPVTTFSPVSSPWSLLTLYSIWRRKEKKKTILCFWILVFSLLSVSL